MRFLKIKYMGLTLLFLALLSLSSVAQDGQWRKKIKRARHNILLFDSAVNNYYNAVLAGQLSSREIDKMINGSIAARQSINEIKACPEDYAEKCRVLEEIYDLIREKELMAENRQVAFDHLEEWKTCKKKIDELINELEKLLKRK